MSNKLNSASAIAIKNRNKGLVNCRMFCFKLDKLES